MYTEYSVVVVKTSASFGDSNRCGDSFLPNSRLAGESGSSMTKKWKDVAWPFSLNQANAGQELGGAIS